MMIILTSHILPDELKISIHPGVDPENKYITAKNAFTDLFYPGKSGRPHSTPNEVIPSTLHLSNGLHYYNIIVFIIDNFAFQKT